MMEEKKELIETSSFVVPQLRSWRDRWKRFFLDYPPLNGENNRDNHIETNKTNSITQTQSNQNGIN